MSSNVPAISDAELFQIRLTRDEMALAAQALAWAASAGLTPAEKTLYGALAARLRDALAGR